MSVRARVLMLLVGLLGFMVVAAGVALSLRTRAGHDLERVMARDVPLLSVATEVTAEHLEQSIRLERMLRHSRERGSEARRATEEAKAQYERFAQDIWHRLQEAQRMSQQSAALGDPGSAAVVEQIQRIDAAHNAYASGVRGVFSLLEEGRHREAVQAIGRLEAEEEQLRHALGMLLRGSASSAEQAAAAAHREHRIASSVAWTLMGTGLLLAALVFAIVVRLVSEMRTLEGLLPICFECKKIRDDRGYWNQLEAYFETHSEVAFTHGICSECQDALRERIQAERTPAAVS